VTAYSITSSAMASTTGENAKAERLGGLEIIAEHPPKMIAVPADLRKHEQTATISRKHFSGSGRIM
jgi:hypothetical protein